MVQLTEEQKQKFEAIKDNISTDYLGYLELMLNKYNDSKKDELLNLDLKKLKIKIASFKARQTKRSEEKRKSNIYIDDIIEFAHNLDFNSIDDLIKKLQEVKESNKQNYLNNIQAEIERKQKEIEQLNQIISKL